MVHGFAPEYLQELFIPYRHSSFKIQVCSNEGNAFPKREAFTHRTMIGLVGILLFLVYWTPGCFPMLPDFVKRVDNCPDPNNISQWMERSKMRNCFHNLSSNDPKEQEHVYHCLPSSFLNETVEFCGRNAPIDAGNCPVYNYRFSSNIAPTSSNCSEFTWGCPKMFFFSKHVYNYPNCLKINRRAKCFEAVLKCGNVFKESEACKVCSI